MTLKTPRTVACQAHLSMGFSRQEWSGLPFPLPGDLPNPGIKSESPALQAYSLLLNHQGSPRMVSPHQQTDVKYFLCARFCVGSFLT